MNYKKVKKVIKPKAQKINDSVVSFNELLEKNVPAMDIVNELDQYLSSDVKKDFIEHYKVLYDITDATIVEDPVFTETMIEVQKDKIDEFKYNMKDMLKEGLSPSYIIGAFDHYLNDYYTNRVIEVLKDKLNIKGNFRSIYGVALAANDFAKVVETLDDVELIPDIIREQVVTDTLYHDQYMNNYIEDSYKVTWEEGDDWKEESFTDKGAAEDFADNITSRKDSSSKTVKINGKPYKVKDSIDLNDRAVLVEKYTDDISKLVDDGVAPALEILAVIDNTCNDKIEMLCNTLSEKFDLAESLENKVSDYIEHSKVDPYEALKVISEALPEEDRLIIVDSILED